MTKIQRWYITLETPNDTKRLYGEYYDKKEANAIRDKLNENTSLYYCYCVHEEIVYKDN